jgi:phosphoketolase
MLAPLTPDLLEKMDAYWRAANYLTVGQIYLQDNPLLETALTLEHIKPRLLGHWGTTTGLNFIYVHLNRVIKEHDLNMIYVIGPGHGGPANPTNSDMPSVRVGDYKPNSTSFTKESRAAAAGANKGKPPGVAPQPKDEIWAK